MSTKFDLERFKAGEPAIDDNGDGDIIRYVGTLPNGEICFTWLSEDLWEVGSWPEKDFYNCCTMKHKEEWIYLPTSFDRYSTKEEAENAFGKPMPGTYEAVRIVRD